MTMFAGTSSWWLAARKRQRSLVLDLFEGKARTNVRNPWDFRQLIDDESFHRLDIGNYDPDQVISVSGHEITLHDFWVVLYRFFECL